MKRLLSLDCSMVTHHARAEAKRKSNVDSDSCIEVSDEEVGVCGGLITFDHDFTREMPRRAPKDWTCIDPLPMVRPNVRMKMTNLRPVVIDGSNVSFNNGTFSGKRLTICVETFQKAGHNVIAFLPQFRLMHSLTREAELFDELVESGSLVLTPSRSVEGQMLTPYDDRYIVEYAAQTGAVIVSRDRFGDLLNDNETWKLAIKRRLTFKWYGNDILFPKFPLGNPGPSIREFLCFYDCSES